MEMCMNQEEQIKKSRDLAKEILLLTRDHLLVSLRFLHMALYQFKSFQLIDNNTIGSNGEMLFYDYKYILKTYKGEKEVLARTYLHMVFHWIFYDPFKVGIEDANLWNLATDIAVENIILELNIKAVETQRDIEQKDVIDKLKEKTEITAEKLYKYFWRNPLTEDQLKKDSALFKRDEHSIWGFNLKQKQFDSQIDAEFIYKKFEEQKEEYQEEIQEEWEKISERVKVELETFSKERGEETTALIQNIKEVHRDHYDYGEFLKQFSVLSEEIQVNNDEFDYGFYTYGMQLYGNLPLIEPLEHKEVYKIKDFVIAIDTSGSCSGEVVQDFLNKTYSIMKSTENFFRKVNIHIIQCDAKIQQDTKITSDEEFENFMDNLQLFGFGGTDFRPVFYYVEELIEQGEFDNLKGLIYFTDGYGIFPEWRPKYDVAFVFLDENYNEKKVPSWAIKLVLQEDELKI